MVKLVFLSSGVHQIIFSLRSTLPYAVGQVQDVGLIFLSAMATNVVDACHKAGKDSDTTLGSVLLTLLLTTLLVGVLIILVGEYLDLCHSSISHCICVTHQALSAAATNVVDACHKASKDSDTNLRCVLLTLLLTILLVGVLIILVGEGLNLSSASTIHYRCSKLFFTAIKHLLQCKGSGRS